MERDRHFAGIARQVSGSDGQAMQHFMSNSPWSAQSVYQQIQAEIAETPELRQSGVLIVDDTADEKAGAHSVGSSRQRNGRYGTIDECQVSVMLAYGNWKASLWPIWALVDAELFVPAEWFGEQHAERRKKQGLSNERKFETKAQLGLQMIRRTKQQGVPFELVVCDDAYGRDHTFRAQLDQEGVTYAADVPCSTQVYLHKPEIGLPTKIRKPPIHPRVLNGVPAIRVDQWAQDPGVVWQTLRIRSNERGILEDRFAACRVWTWVFGSGDEPQQEWLIVRIESNGDHIYVLSNAAENISLQQLAEACCSRYFVERMIQDAKQENGWGDFQAQKYLAWEHHTALTACALWFIAQTKLSWATKNHRDPDLIQQFELQVLPALSTANVREMLRAVLPLHQLSPDEARSQVVKHLVNRSRSTSSRLRHRRKSAAPT
jgi:SRSO17 transposase